MKRHLFLPVLVLAVACMGSLEHIRADKPASSESIVVGMANSMVSDVSPPMIDVLGFAFSGMLKEFTGLNGKLVVDGDAARLARNLEEKKVHLGVFQGIELAWLQAKHPNLKQLMILVGDEDEKHLQAQLLIRKDRGMVKISDLKDKQIALPVKSREHCRLFFKRCGAESDSADAKSCFKNVVKSPNVEKALDDLVDGKVDAVFACKSFIDQYKHLKSGRFNQLQVLAASEPFPAIVIAHHADGVSREMLARFRTGMLKASQSERGREILGMWNLTGFEAVPADYQSRLDTILKSHPAPATAVSLR